MTDNENTEDAETTDENRLSPQNFRYFVQGLRQLIIRKHRSDYELGRYMHGVREGRLWDRWPRSDRARPGYGSFQEYCDKELGYSTSKANALASNFRKLSNLELDEDGETFSRCMRLGYSKLNVLLRVVGDEDNLIAWLNDIEGRKLSELALRARVEEARRAYAEAAAAVAGEGGEEGEGGSDDPMSPINPAGYVPYVMRFENQESIDTFTRAVETIRNRYDASIGLGQCITMMALHYHATVPRAEEGGAPIEVENLIRMFESAYGIRLKVDNGRRRRRSTITQMQDEQG